MAQLAIDLGDARAQRRWPFFDRGADIPVAEHVAGANDHSAADHRWWKPKGHDLDQIFCLTLAA
jgi:hypothetical protein